MSVKYVLSYQFKHVVFGYQTITHNTYFVDI